MPPRARTALPLLALPLALLAAGCGDDESAAPTPSVNLDPYLTAPTSCAYVCPNETCPEATTPYVCPSLGPWASIPHLETCPAWDGSYPAVKPGSCAATEPAADALLRPSAGQGTHHLPDGRDAKPAGAEWIFDDLEGSTTVAVAAVTGTPYVLTVDTGKADHAVRAVDTAQIGAGNPVTGIVKLSPPEYLNAAIAVVPPGRAYVATDYGVVQALSLDPATGALARDDAASLELPPAQDGGGYYVAGVAASPDGRRLVVSPVDDTRVLVYDTDPASPTYRAKLGEVDTGARETFGVYFDPADAAGARAYVSVWGGRKVLEIELDDPAAPAVGRAFDTDKNPQGIAFLDGRWMAVANDLGETLSIIDRVSGDVTSVPVDFEPGLRGLDVSGLGFDPVAGRLYAVLAGINAVAAYDVDLTAAPPALSPAGRLPSSWWPSGIAVHPDGALTVVNMRGGGMGAFDAELPIGEGDGWSLMRGSVQRIPPPSAADLAAGDTEVRTAAAVGERPGYPTIDCPAGASDFPVPATNTGGPSPVIDRIIFIVRENKTFDALMGDMAGVEGDPDYAMKASSEDMDRIWKNFRDIGRAFTIADNFYNLAVQSSQGHQWTTYGRSSDICERTWSSDSRAVGLCGVGDVGMPEEGSLFDWLGRNDVPYDILGEIVGSPAELPPDRNPIDIRYPGGPFQNIGYSDIEKACHVAGRLRVACDLGRFVYMTLPNDHTLGVSPDNPTAETMCAVNDEATGMVLDALSHSPLWASSLLVITEDDPQQGGDHVDYHRTPLVLASPWIKRGYVSKAHIDVASLHKLFAHVLGLPYPNVVVKNAALPLDMFTSTPDYTPYTYAPRAWPLACGAAATRSERTLTDSWDFRYVDEQPGLGDQVMRWMRGRQLQEIPPDLQRRIDDRMARKARGLPPLDEDGDRD